MRLGKASLSALAGAAIALAALTGSTKPQAARAPEGADWRVYDADAQGDHYSPLSQINTSNVAKLREVWRIDGPAGGLETNPLVIGGVLYGYSATGQPFAADASTGKPIWSFNSGVISGQPSRGLTYWTDGSTRRLFAGVLDRLYALDPATGKPVASFGEGGFIDLRKHLGPGDYTKNATYLTSPGVIYKDLIIVGFRTSETKPAARGWIRAYDVRTGELRWTFHTIPLPGDRGYGTWPKDAWKTAGAANNWAGMAVDQKRGMVFVPTGSAVDDMYGADRKGDDLYADCLLALDATGRLIWHFQGVHHDLWDRDFPSPPVLLTLERQGQRIDAVAQTTKQGFVYVFDRATGRPLFPIVERPFPPSDVPGEAASPTQPVALSPAPFARQRVREAMLTRRTPAAHAWAVAQFRTFKGGGLFVPYSVGKPTIVFPGYDGGAEWGGPAADPRTGVIYVNANDLVWTGSLARYAAAEQGETGPGRQAYVSECAACHGVDRRGSPPQIPPLLGVGASMSHQDVAALLAHGAGRMPAFPDLRGPTLDALIEYVRSGREPSAAGERQATIAAPAAGLPRPKYVFTGYKRFLDPDGYPAVEPPWGTLNAIDLNTGRYLWRIPLGEYPALARAGLRDTGTENYGGPILTAGGLVIIAATVYDARIRAFDARSGRLLWQAALPFAGTATPATYMVGGRQYIVIATSGGKNPLGPQGSAYVAFALPRGGSAGASRGAGHRRLR